MTTDQLATTHSFEIEIKSLLGSKEAADTLKKKLTEVDPASQLISRNQQLNHYFVTGDVQKLALSIQPYITTEESQKLQSIVSQGRDVSVRTRQQDDTIIFVLKASIDDTTSSNGTARLEFEAKTPGLTLQELDELILTAGFSYQAKWSREREEFQFQNMHVCIDKNAGYGYLAEFEAVVSDPTQADATKLHLREIMNTLGVTELPQDRLERMFAHYNTHWQEYYGTDNTFTIE